MGRSDKKIMFLITGLGMGGAENITIALAEHMAERKYNVTIAYLTGEVSIFPKNKWIKIIPLGVKKKSDILFLFWKLLNIIKTNNPNIIHAHMFHSIILARAARLFCKIPKLICTEHNSEVGGIIRLLLFRLTDPLADATCFVSRASLKVFEKAGAVKNGRVIYNAIDTENYTITGEQGNNTRKALGIDLSSKLILAVGRLEKIKDYPNLFHALAILRNKTDFKCLIAGDGTQIEQLKALSEELEISSQVVFLGIRRDIPKLMAAADVFVLSSMSEGLPLVVAEAMAAGSIVVATDCGGVREVVGNAGYLVPPHNSEALASMISNALELDEDIKIQLSKKAREQIKSNYTMSVMLKNYTELYEETN